MSFATISTEALARLQEVLKLALQNFLIFLNWDFIPLYHLVIIFLQPKQSPGD